MASNKPSSADRLNTERLELAIQVLDLLNAEDWAAARDLIEANQSALTSLWQRFASGIGPRQVWSNPAVGKSVHIQSPFAAYLMMTPPASDAFETVRDALAVIIESLSDVGAVNVPSPDKHPDLYDNDGRPRETGRRFLEALDEPAQKLDVIRRRANYESLNTVKQWSKPLQDAGLIRRDENRVWVRTPKGTATLAEWRSQEKHTNGS